MRIICLMGRRGTDKNLVESKLEKLGYNRVISYTTREPKDDEINGREYHFVNKESFFTLVKKQIIMEWTEFEGHLYGSPHPIGSINNVVVVEPDGYNSIKNAYGKQVTGAFIRLQPNLMQEKLEKRKNKAENNSVIDLVQRRDSDDYKFKDIESKVDLVIDGERDVESITAEILEFIASKH